MPDFTVNSFNGSVPRLAQHLIKRGMAKRALDCNLHSGQISCWRDPKLVRSLPNGVVLAEQAGCCWFDFTTCVHVARGSATCQQVFVTGREEYPEELTWAEGDCVTHSRRLGMPCPTKKPNLFEAVSDNTPTDRDQEGRAYAYQYESSTGARSQLSPATVAEDASDGDHFYISGWDIPDPAWDVTTVRIYRSVSGDSYGTSTSHKVDTTWMYVGSIDVNDTGLGFSDQTWNDELFEALEGDFSSPPPASLRGITWIESINTLAGFVGNQLYFSKNNEYNNWPHIMTLDDNICGIVESNGVIYVATDGAPYVVEAVTDCEHAGCRSAVRLPYSMPMVSCTPKGIIDTSLGAVYASHKGLVILSGKGKPVILTWPWYSPEDWQSMAPHTAVLAEFDGKLYCFMANGAFALTMPEGPEAGWGADGHTELSDREVSDAFVTRQGQFMLLMDGPDGHGLYEWNRGDKLRPHEWESNEHVEPTPYAYGAGHLFFENGLEHVKVEVDGSTALDRFVLAHQVFRLPMWADGTRWKFTLKGTATVSLMSLATTMQDLGR